MAELSDIVRTQTQVLGAGTAPATFGWTLFLTKDDSLLGAKGVSKARIYSTLQQLQVDFDTETEPYKAGIAYFAQTGHKNFVVGRWANDATGGITSGYIDTVIYGGSVSPDVTELEAIDDGSLTLDGVSISGIDFDSQTALTGIATVLQTSLRAVTDTRFASSTTVEWDATDSRFVITFPGTSVFNGVFRAGTVGTNLTTLLGLNPISGATYQEGGAEESSPADALNEIDGIGIPFTFVTTEHSLSSTYTHMKSIADWVNATRNKQFLAGVSGYDTTITDEDTSVGAQLSDLGYDTGFLTWSREADYHVMSVAGYLSAMDFNQPNSIRTLNLRELPGFNPSILSTTQRTELRRKRINYIDSVLGLDCYREGWTTNERLFVESQSWLLWIDNEIKVAVFNFLRAAPYVPYTTEGLDSLKGVVEGVMDRGVASGGIAPGFVSYAMRQDIRITTGENSFSGELTTGYRVHMGSAEDVTQTQRFAREAPPMKVWMKSSGAIHSASITLVYEN